MHIANAYAFNGKTGSNPPENPNKTSNEKDLEKFCAMGNRVPFGSGWGDLSRWYAS